MLAGLCFLSRLSGRILPGLFLASGVGRNPWLVDKSPVSAVVAFPGVVLGYMLSLCLLSETPIILD